MQVLAGLLNIADKADWRNCMLGKEEETKMVEDFKKRFEAFDPNQWFVPLKRNEDREPRLLICNDRADLFIGAQTRRWLPLLPLTYSTGSITDYLLNSIFDIDLSLQSWLVRVPHNPLDERKFSFRLQVLVSLVSIVLCTNLFPVNPSHRVNLHIC